MANLDGLDRRLGKLEAQRSSSRLSWKTSDGRRVSFSLVPEMLAAQFELFEAQGAALVGDPVPTPGRALAALLSTSEEELLRLSETLSWVATVSQQWAFVLEPPE